MLRALIILLKFYIVVILIKYIFQPKKKKKVTWAEKINLCSRILRVFV